VISYAQQAEDVVLQRVFEEKPTGRYIDVGAGDPELDSVTKHFYDKGWSGVNIEPAPGLYSALVRTRPRDTNLNVAIGRSAGVATLHMVSNAWGRATTDEQLACRYAADPAWELDSINVDQLSLTTVLDHYHDEIDFLKIDVERAEYEVIAGTDWERHQPRVIVVEATEPGLTIPSHERWEPLLITAGYRCALFDGLNRFYARCDDNYALTRLAAPANVFDDYESRELASLRAEVAGFPAVRAGEAAYIRRLENELREVRDSFENKVRELADMRQSKDTARTASEQRERYVAALEARIVELESRQ